MFLRGRVGPRREPDAFSPQRRFAYNGQVLRRSLRILRAQPWPREPFSGRPRPAGPPPLEDQRERLGARFADPRTLLSFVLVALVVAFVLTHTRFDYAYTLGVIRRTNPLPYAAAFVAFYLSFVVRSVRWRLLLASAGERVGLGGIGRMLMLAWFANCLLPAKMGDFYRAYLLRRDYPVSGSKGLGTIITERFLDFLVLMGLLILAGLISFHNHVPAAFVPALVAGLVISLGILTALLAARLSNGRLSRLLPRALAVRTVRFKAGLLDSLGNVPALLALTLSVWMLESLRLYLVLQALPLQFSASLPQVVFIALVASLLTTIPALPGGLVLVEGGIVAVLAFFGLDPSAGLSVALLDRVVSYWSIIAVGFGVFLVSHRR